MCTTEVIFRIMDSSSYPLPLLFRNQCTVGAVLHMIQTRFHWEVHFGNHYSNVVMLCTPCRTRSKSFLFSLPLCQSQVQSCFPFLSFHTTLSLSSPPYISRTPHFLQKVSPCGICIPHLGQKFGGSSQGEQSTQFNTSALYIASHIHLPQA